MTPASMPGHATPKTYLWIWGWLAGLMLLGVGLSELPVPKVLIILGILFLSSIKAILVALYYMHLKFDRKMLILVAAFPLLIILLAVLLVLSGSLVVL